MGNRPHFRRPSIMLMSSTKLSPKSPFPYTTETFASEHSLSIPRVRSSITGERRGTRVTESGNAVEAGDFVVWQRDRSISFRSMRNFCPEMRIFNSNGFNFDCWLNVFGQHCTILQSSSPISFGNLDKICL